MWEIAPRWLKVAAAWAILAAALAFATLMILYMLVLVAFVVLLTASMVASHGWKATIPPLIMLGAGAFAATLAGIPHRLLGLEVPIVVWPAKANADEPREPADQEASSKRSGGFGP